MPLEVNCTGSLSLVEEKQIKDIITTTAVLHMQARLSQTASILWFEVMTLICSENLHSAKQSAQEVTLGVSMPTQNFIFLKMAVMVSLVSVHSKLFQTENKDINI